MGFIALGLGAAALGVGSAVGGFLSAPKSAPRYNYGQAYTDLANYSDNAMRAIGWVEHQPFAGVASYQPVDAVSYGNQAINFNMQNMDAYNEIARQSNEQALQDRLSALDVISPRWQEQRDQADRTNEALMRGEIPLDVQQQMARNSAYQSFQAGYSGSPSARQGTLARDLGITSLGLTTLGQQQAQSWLQLNSELAMPDQVSGAQIMDTVGFDAPTAIQTALTNAAADTDTQLANLSNIQRYNEFKTGVQMEQAKEAKDVYADELNVRLGILSQFLADSQAQTEMTQEANAALWGGIGNSIGGGLGTAATGLM